MSSCLEINPQKFTIVLGPTFATQVVEEILDNDISDNLKLPTFDFKSIVDRGVSYLLKKETLASDSDREKFVARYNNAYELDPVFVLRKIISSLQSADCYEEWLEELFACHFPTKKASKSLERLLSLQSQGALLVYVHCDDIIARAAGQEPVLLEDAEQMERWTKGECVGILQPHGVYSQPDTVTLDCLLYESTTHPAFERLRQLLCSRNTILLGEGSSKDPFLTHFCKRFISESAEPNSFVFTTAKDCTDLPGLPLYASSPFPAVYPTTPTSADLWKQIKVELMPSSPPCQYQVVCLLVSSQTGARDISLMMFNAPGVNFALVNPVMYGNTPAFCVSLRVSSSSLHQLWSWLLTSSHDVLVSCGLTGIVLQDGTFFWLQDPATISHRGEDADCSSSSADVDTRSANSTTASTSPPAGTNSTPHNVHSTGPQITTSPSSQTGVGGGSEVRTHSKIIQRYKVVKKRSPIVGVGSSHGDMGSYSGHFLSKTCEEAGTGSHHTRRYLYARRGSLPPIKCGEPGNALALLAERLQHTDISSTLPSYVAIKRALLSDKFKHIQNPISGLGVPRMLLNLLQAKKDPNEKPNLLAHRRNSDPGSYLQHRDKARRRQLFFDENMQWMKTHGSIIERKIRSWKQQRLLRMQREYFYLQQGKLSACHKKNEICLVDPSKLVTSPFYSSLASSTVSSSLTSLPQTFMAAAGSGVNGFSTAPFMYQLPSAGLTQTPMLVPAPFVSPYAFMGSYTTIPVTGAAQPTATYIIPPTALAAAGAQQRIVFLPSVSSAGTTGSPVSIAPTSDHVTDTKPPFSSLLAPTSPPISEPEPAVVSSSRKRKNAFPEKLSSLLQPPTDSHHISSPDEKKVCTVSRTVHKGTRHRHSSVSPPPPSHTHHTSSHSSSYTTREHRSHHDHHSHHMHHRHHHHYRHSHHSTSHHSTSSYSHYHHPSSPPLHSHKSPSPLEQCLLQSPPSPGSDGRAVDSPGGSPSSYSSAASTDHSSHSPPQLWQFLLELLLTTNCSHLIQWTDSAHECEFTIHEPVQVAELWGKCINNSAMNSDKLAKGLRYYYSKGIIEKVDGKKLTFRYNGLARSYIKQHFGKTVDVTGSMEEMVVVE